jgi:hypothetical protein
MARKSLKATKAPLTRITRDRKLTSEEAAKNNKVIAAVKQEFPPASPPERVKMSQERYLAIAKRICLHRHELVTFIRGFVHGTETGYVDTQYFGKPAPAHIMKWAEARVMPAIEELNAALFALEHQWLTK